MGDEVKSEKSKESRNSLKQEDIVDVEKIKTSQDLRTYLCIKNLPCRYSKEEFKSEVDRNHFNRYTTVNYIPDKKDLSKKSVNRSYIFIHFKHPLFVLDFANEF
jgi:hypothetical protein